MSIRAVAKKGRFALAFVVLVQLSLFDAAPARAGLGDQLHKLTASDAAANDNFGVSVAISGDTAIVGAFLDDDAGSSSGSAYLFDVATGSQLFKLSASDAAANDRFGELVAISGNTAIVGAPFNSPGAAYLFDVTTGSQLFKLTAADVRGAFGNSVAISGNTAIVGASFDGLNSGSAHLFDVTTGSQVFKLTASDAASDDFFGVSVAVSGNTAIVGAIGNDDAGSASGSAYLFDVMTGAQLFKLTASDATAFDNFGLSVAISGETAIVGVPSDDDAGSGSGSAYLFDVNTGSQLFKLTATDAAVNHFFGHSVAISGDTAIVGAYGNGVAGSAYLFDIRTGTELLKLTASDAASNDSFGESVAISGNTVIVGARGKNNGTGSAYLFRAVPEPGTLALASLALLGRSFGRRDWTRRKITMGGGE